jgi:predicted transcriptional regulator
MKISSSDRSKKTMPVSVRLRPAINKELGKIGAALDRPKSWLIEQALNDYVETQKWQIAAIEEGIREADAGLTIPHKEVVRWIRSLGTSKELSRPRPKTKKR